MDAVYESIINAFGLYMYMLLSLLMWIYLFIYFIGVIITIHANY